MRLVLACLLSLLYSTTSGEALASERDAGSGYRSVAYYASWVSIYDFFAIKISNDSILSDYGWFYRQPTIPVTFSRKISPLTN